MKTVVSLSIILINILSAHAGVEKLLSQLSSPQKQGVDFYSLGSGIHLEGCRSYPHYSIIFAENRNGHKRLAKDIHSAIDKGLRCLVNPENNFAPIHLERANKVIDYLSDTRLRKTFACLPGIGTNAIARSNFPNFNPNSYEFSDYKGLVPDFPGIIFNTNLMANQERLFVMPKLAWWKNDVATEFKRHAQARLMDRGTPRQTGEKVDATAMLVFHEMMHWAEVFHAPGMMDDILVYEMACFGQNTYDRSSNPDLVEKAKKFLQDKEYWSANEKEKKFLAAQKKYHALTMEMLYHKSGTLKEFELPKRQLPKAWQKFQFGKTLLYGPTENVEMIKAILIKAQKSQNSMLKYFVKGFYENNFILYLDKLRNPQGQELNIPDKHKFQAIYSSIISDLKSEGLYSGEEVDEDFLAQLLRNEFGQTQKYFASFSQNKVSYPRPLGINDWVGAIFFRPQDKRILPTTINGGTYEVNLEENLILTLANFSMYLSRQTTQDGSRSFSGHVLQAYLNIDA